MFFISVASKGLRVYVSGLESTLASISISVDSKWVSEEMPGQLSGLKGRTLADRRAIGKHRNLQRPEIQLLLRIGTQQSDPLPPPYTINLSCYLHTTQRLPSTQP